MNVVKCTGGHFFDIDTYRTCPHCGAPVAPAPAPAAEPKKSEKKGLFGKKKKEELSPVMTQMTPTPPAPPAGTPPYYNPYMQGAQPQVPPQAQPQPRVAPPTPPTPPQKDAVTLDFWQTAAHSAPEAPKPPVAQPIPEAPKPPVAQPAPEAPKPPVAQPMPEAPKPPVAQPMPEAPKPPVAQPMPEAPKPPVAQSMPAPQSGSLKDAVQRVAASNEGKTMSFFSSVTSGENKQVLADPVVGWLVCVGGNNAGESFEIHAGQNSIGRSTENRIVIGRDGSISRSKHAFVVYEPKKSNFYLQPGDSTGLTYLNGDYITEAKYLSPRDIIELGDSKLLFVPLCGADFSWEKYMQK